MDIGFVGVGSMGRAIILRLTGAGHRVSAWSRSSQALADLNGVVALDEPARAFEHEVVISMLADDRAVEQTLLTSDVLAMASQHCIHVIMSTLSPTLIARLHALHDRAGVALVVAPLFGVPTTVSRGEANVLVAGPAQAIETVQTLFDVLAEKTWRLGENPVHACITKIAGNMMITQAIESLGEATRLAQAYGVRPRDFTEILTQTLFACPIYQRYGTFIADSIHEPGFKLSLGLKDVDLALEAASDKALDLPAAKVVRAAMSQAVANGLGDRDWSAFASLERHAAAPPERVQLWGDAPLITTRRGHFWLTGKSVAKDGKHFQKGPMFVAWEAPEHVTQPYPVVLVHGGTLQGTEWGTTPDGRPGWAQRFIEKGYAVFCVDRPGHGRSPYHPEIMGPMGPAFSYERAREVYFPVGGGETQWPFSTDDEAAFDAFIAAYGPMPADLAASQTLDAERLGQLLDRIGTSIIVTHSASGPDGWLLADRKPGKIAAIVAVEPMGPVFGETPGIGALDWGLTAAPVTFEPPLATVEQVRTAAPSTLKIPGLKGVPVGLVTGETSVFATFASSIVPFLRNAGADVDHLDLPALGIRGNGHGLIYERNSDDVFRVVAQWLSTVAGRQYT